MVEVGQQAPDLSLVDFHNDSVRLSSLWTSSPIMFFFHRNLGCLFAKQAFKRLDCSVGQLETHGVRLVSIVPATASDACAFCADGDYWHTCLADAKLESYRAFGVKRAGLFQMIGPQPLRSLKEAVTRGYRPSGRPIGNAFVMPAVVVVKNDGIITSIRYSKHVGDIPTVSELIQMVSSLPTPPAS
ncbi:MAG: redoxin domain-containing protein [Armatimonadota bacterium]